MGGLHLMRVALRTFAAVLLLTVMLMILARRADSGWIAYAMQEDGNTDIFLMTGNGRSRRQISPDRLCGTAPQWSPGGQWIAFIATCSDRGNPYRIGPTGTRLKSLSNVPYYVLGMQWSPDGERLLVTSGELLWDLRIVDINSGDEFYLGYDYPHQFWSPDGKWIFAFVFLNESYKLDRIHAQTGATERVGGVAGGFPDMSWSPDGTQGVLAMPFEKAYRLFLLSPDGSTLQSIPIDLPPRVSEPRWSPDGEWIAFFGEDGIFMWHIYRIRPDGSDLERLTEHADYRSSLQWSSDSAWLVFADNKGNIFRMRADGSSLEDLTPGPESTFYPQYAPVSGLNWHSTLMIVAALGMFMLSMMGIFRR